jgi:holo-[acyl-carrier protein] synthase|tara:strand:- start:682 stop:1059 length:378 start_codon:yes stop_codon:yes gene_type:complete
VIKGIGIDLIDNSRIQVLHEKYGQVFAKKILSEAEIIEFKKSRSPVSYLAKHFASKEALSKALGTGLYRRGIFPSNLTVDHDDAGKPFFIQNDSLLEVLKSISASNIFLSISDTNSHSTAMVLVE